MQKIVHLNSFLTKLKPFTQVMSERVHATEKMKIRIFSPIIKQETVLERSVVPKSLCKVSSSHPKYSPKKIKESEISFSQPPFRSN